MYKRINRYLANNNVIHLPLEIGGNNKEIRMLFTNWSDFYKVRFLMDERNIATKGIEISGTSYFSNVHLKNVIEMKLKEIK